MSCPGRRGARFEPRRPTEGMTRTPSITLAGGVRLVLATGWLARVRGLAGRRAPPADGAALVLAPCRSVHTFGMRFGLDLVWLGRNGGVVRVDRGVPPWRGGGWRGGPGGGGGGGGGGGA